MSSVVDTALKIDGVLGRLPEVKWAKSVFSLLTDLMLHCQNYIVEYLHQLTSSKKIYSLFQVSYAEKKFNIICDVCYALIFFEVEELRKSSNLPILSLDTDGMLYPYHLITLIKIKVFIWHQCCVLTRLVAGMHSLSLIASCCMSLPLDNKRIQ